MLKPVLMDFYATWCGPCRLQSPKLDKLREIVGDQIDIQKIDVDANMELAERYGIVVVPTIIIEKNGEVVHKREGVTEAEELKVLIDPLI